MGLDRDFIVHSLICLPLLISPAYSSELPTQYHARERPKLEFFDTNPSVHVLVKSDVVIGYLKEHYQTYGYQEDLSDLRLVNQKKSLLGHHYTFQQFKDNLPISDSAIIISTDKSNRTITKVYNTILPGIDGLHSVKQSSKLMSENEAYDLAWKHLKVHGNLIEQPKITKFWRPIDGRLTQIFKVELSLTAPYGAWVVEINAENGKVIQAFDQRQPRKKTLAVDYTNYQGPIADRTSEFARVSLQKRSFKTLSAVQSADLQTQVFDPDPRTFLADATLEDNSDPLAFIPAYVSRTLKDVSFDGTNYRLRGPWVSIIDFDPPSTPPHEQNNQDWVFERGSNPFNEAMTYFHIDQSQRYIQSLGFSGETGIQQLSMEVDADGVSGDDNSYFQPSTNRLSFGHGCVDDNEDADVILHEYGHAIQKSIVSSWGGGDTGAMGEGFGDYWAASYSVSLEQGYTYNPNHVFDWDGHGVNNSCWNGRILDAWDARYDHSQRYSAHSPIQGGHISDELWSTPLFQSLLELLELGVPREEVDQIVLQSHFGLGSNIKMRDMALSTVDAARNLFPGGVHADIFYKNFVRHNIIGIPKAKIAYQEVSFFNQDHDKEFQPGDTISLYLDLVNTGDVESSDITITMSSSSPEITFEQSSTTINPLPVNEHYQSGNELSFVISEQITCGERIPIKVTATHQIAGLVTEIVTELVLVVGIPEGVDLFDNVNLAIPDNNSTGITSTLDIAVGNSALVSQNFKVKLDVTHTYIGDLNIDLIAPDETKIALHSRSGGGNDNIVGTYPSTLEPSGNLNSLLGKPLDGVWKLRIIDNVGVDVGILNSWGIEDILGYTCQ